MQVHRRRSRPVSVCTCATRSSTEPAGLDSLDQEDWDRAEAILRGEPWPPGTASSPPGQPDASEQQQPSERELSRRQADLQLDREEVYPPWAQSGVKLEYLQLPKPDEQRQGQGGFLSSFRGKLRAAWAIFFPNSGSGKSSSSRNAGLNRLKVVLVADRVGMTPGSFQDMKKSIVTALGVYVEITDEADVEIAMSEHPELGAIYSVSVPVRRVKSENRFGRIAGASDSLLDADGVTLSWDESNWDSDPSERFPFGV
jgi:septum formation topological specificity factor MinE